MKTHSLVVAIFYNADAAIDAIHELRQTGFSDDQLGFVVRQETDEHQTNIISRDILHGLLGTTETLLAATNEHSSISVITAGIIGGILGTIAILQLPDIGPVVAGGTLAALLGNAPLQGITGNFLTLGVPKSKISRYEQEFQAGHIIFTVKADKQQQDVHNVLRYHRAQNIDVH